MTTFLELAKEAQKNYDAQIVLAFADGRPRELWKHVDKEKEISFITKKDELGIGAVRRSTVFLMLRALHALFNSNELGKVWIHFSVDKGLYCTIDGDITLDEEFLKELNLKMQALVDADLPITKRKVNISEVEEIYRSYGLTEKAELVKYRRVSKMSLYDLDGLEEYFYGYMVPSTGYLKHFSLHLYKEGFVIQMPVKEDPEVVPPFHPADKIVDAMRESTILDNVLNILTVSDLNEEVIHGNPQELVLVCEALQEKKVAEIAAQIASNPKIRFVLIAGPSSSGKTTFSKRLTIQLKANGLKTYALEVDNYFVNREDTPRDEKGNLDFECLEAMDVDLLNQNLADLMAGKCVDLPTFNFKTGAREYRGVTKKLEDNEILVIEGIHCLNEALTPVIPRENKFKVYISALTQLNIDEHNRIPTTDGRLLRRIVRDARTRGTSAKTTIGMWYSVRRGEEKNIFPYQEEADAVFNSALLYELAVLKPYAERVLFDIEDDCPEYLEAKRLLKFLDYFVVLGREDVPANSLVREFIGGGCFDV